MSKLKEIRIEDFSYPNLGIGSYQGQEVRVKNSLPGRLVSARLGKQKQGYIMAKHYQDLEGSPMERYLGCGNLECGGCAFQAVSYEDEKRVKVRGIEKLAQDKGLDLDFIYHDNPQPRGYRNKMEYTFGDRVKGGQLYLGLHRKKKFYEIVPTYSCNIAHPDFEKIRSAVQEYFRRNGQSQYIRTDHKGFLRHLVVRYSLTRSQVLVNLVTSSQDELDEGAFVSLIKGLDLEADLVGVLNTINDSLSDAVICEELRVLDGQDQLYERVLGLDFKVSAFSFFQPNVPGIERLYARVRDMAQVSGSQLAFDLYSGTGTIAQILAQSCDQVIGVEIVEEAVEAARENARLNGIDNVKFIANDVLNEIGRLDYPADLIVLDPPRAGIHPKALKGIIDHRPKNFIYISCNPRSMFQDLHAFKEAGYELASDIEIYDQFTRTYHLEALAHLSRAGR